MAGRVGSTTPQAPRSGVRGNRFCRAYKKLARACALSAPAKLGETAASLRRPGSAWHAWNSGETDLVRTSGEGSLSLSGRSSTKKKEPRRPDAGGATVLAQSRGSQRTMWVVPSSAGVSRLTRRRRSQLGPNSGAPILRLT
jgi:hypothetical protein